MLDGLRFQKVCVDFLCGCSLRPSPNNTKTRCPLATSPRSPGLCRGRAALKPNTMPRATQAQPKDALETAASMLQINCIARFPVVMTLDTS